jgi:uncharacterized LabA/DUF88 family protein
MADSGKTALFIDGPNLHSTAKALGFDLDFKRLLEPFERRGTVVRSYYYTTVSENTELRPLLDWLDYNGFTVREKRAKEFDDGEGRRKIKRNVCVDLVVDALEIAAYVDHIVLFTGNGDFRSLVEAVQQRGVFVTLVSSMRTKPAMIADELRRQADAFIDLDDLRAAICRTLPFPSERKA